MLTYRWLGTAGLELRCEGFTLLIDPFFTRPPRRALLGPLRADAALTARMAPRADALLITHAHYDHLLDAPAIALRTGALAYGPPNACDLLALHGVPAEQARLVRPGDCLAVGPFAVEVFPARHTPVPRLLNGPLPERLQRRAEQIRQSGAPPERPPRLGLFDYRMDACYSYRIRVRECGRIRGGGPALLVGSHPAECDLLFISPFFNERWLADMLRAANPRQVTLIHWDDFTRPLGQPPLPMIVTPMQAARPGRLPWPPLRRLDVAAAAEMLRSLLPGVEVRVGEMFKEITTETQSTQR